MSALVSWLVSIERTRRISGFLTVAFSRRGHLDH